MPPEITEYDGILRYQVEAGGGRDTDSYLVELDAFDGVGKCSCADFRCRKAPLIRAAAPNAPQNKFRCRHILAVRERLLDQVISALHENKKASTAQKED